MSREHQVSREQAMRNMVCYMKGFGIYPSGDGDALMASERGWCQEYIDGFEDML